MTIDDKIARAKELIAKREEIDAELAALFANPLTEGHALQRLSPAAPRDHLSCLPRRHPPAFQGTVGRPSGARRMLSLKIRLDTVWHGLFLGKKRRER